MKQFKGAFISFGFFAYPADFIKENSLSMCEYIKNSGIDINYFGPVITREDGDRAAEELLENRFDYIIAHVTTWTETPNVIRVLGEFKDIPVIVWGMGGKTQNGTLVSPASPAGTSALLFTMKQMGMKYKYIYDYPDQEPRYDEVIEYISIIHAVKNLNGARVGAMGYCDMGLYALMLDGVALKERLGMDVEDIFSYEVGKIVQEAPSKIVDEIIQEIKCEVCFDKEPSYEHLEKTARLAYALRKKIKERNLIGMTMKCVYGVSRYMDFTPCLTQALLAKDTTSICESDIAGLVTQVVLKEVTGQTPTFMEHYEYYTDKILVGVCGFVPFDLAKDKVGCMCTGWGGFSGIYETGDIQCGKITIARLFTEKGELKMLLLTAQAENPQKWAELGWDEPMPQFPSLMIRPDCSVDSYIENMPAQHINIIYGDWTNRLKEFCKLTGIKAIEIT